MSLLAVTYTHAGVEWRADSEREPGALPGRGCVVETAESPDDLAGLGIVLSE